MTNSIALRSGLAFESPRPVREDRREVRVAARAGDLKHIFLIAGPSGSGKSTIMSEFVYDRLPKDISDSPARGQKLAAHERQRAVAGRASAHPSAPCPHARPRGPLRYHAPLCQTLRALRQRSSHQRADRIRCGADSADPGAEPRGSARSSSSSAPPIATMSSGGTSGAGRARSSARSAKRSTGSPARSRSS